MLEMRDLTKKTMRPSEKLEMVGDERIIHFSDDHRRKGTNKLS
jgi:hypothetical protein